MDPGGFRTFTPRLAKVVSGAKVYCRFSASIFKLFVVLKMGCYSLLAFVGKGLSFVGKGLSFVGKGLSFAGWYPQFGRDTGKPLNLHLDPSDWGKLSISDFKNLFYITRYFTFTMYDGKRIWQIFVRDFFFFYLREQQVILTTS